MFESSHFYIYLKLAVTTFHIYKEKLLNSFSKILLKYFAAIDRATIQYLLILLI